MHDMTDAELRVAVAERLGWKWWYFFVAGHKAYHLVEPEWNYEYLNQPCGKVDAPKDDAPHSMDRVPDWPHNLNAAFRDLVPCIPTFILTRLVDGRWRAGGWPDKVEAETPGRAICVRFLKATEGK